MKSNESQNPEKGKRSVPVRHSVASSREILTTAELYGEEVKRVFLEAEGHPLSGNEVAQRLGVSSEEVEARRAAGELIAAIDGKGGFLYPNWQFSNDRLLPGIADALSELASQDIWAKIGYFLTTNARLDGSTPLEKLQDGDVEAVCMAARSYGEHGAA